MTTRAPLHAIITDVSLVLDTPFQSKTLTITLKQVYSGSATPLQRDDFPSFTTMDIPEEYRTALLDWLEHRCVTPETGLPGDVWICPVCLHQWWADDLDADTDADDGGLFIAWRPTA